MLLRNIPATPSRVPPCSQTRSSGRRFSRGVRWTYLETNAHVAIAVQCLSNTSALSQQRFNNSSQLLVLHLNQAFPPSTHNWLPQHPPQPHACAHFKRLSTLASLGVAAVTGTLSNLANHFESRFKTTGQGAVRSYAQLVESMRAAVGSLFLSAEASFAQIYSRLYKGHSYRCSNCYHFFGVDLIADVQGGMHVIEVNVSPDLTLSHEGCNTPGGCLGGSDAYDYTKQAAAFNAVQIVYGIESVAESLSTLLRRHSAEITAPRFARLLQPARKGLKREVIEYLLEYLREGLVAGALDSFLTLAWCSLRFHSMIVWCAFDKSSQPHDAISCIAQSPCRLFRLCLPRQCRAHPFSNPFRTIAGGVKAHLSLHALGLGRCWSRW